MPQRREPRNILRSHLVFLPIAFLLLRARLVVEGAVIVGSILLAFGIEAWCDEHYAHAALNLHLLDIITKLQID